MICRYFRLKKENTQPKPGPNEKELSTIINSGQTRTRVIEIPTRVTRSFHYVLEKTLVDSHDKSEHVQSRGERKSFRANESESLTSPIKTP